MCLLSVPIPPCALFYPPTRTRLPSHRADWRTDNPDSDGQPPYTPGQDDIPQTCQSAPSCTRCFCVEWEASFQAQRGFSPWSPSYQGCDSDPTCATCREWRSFCSECDEIGDITLTDLDRTSLANVGDDDPLLWAHVAFMALATVLVLTLLSRYNSDTITLRLRYLATIAPGGQSTSVLVTDIPGTLAGTPLGQVLWMIDKGAWFIPGFLRRRVLEQVQAITLRLHEIAHVGLRALSDAPSLGGRRRLVLTGAANRGVEGAEGAEVSAGGDASSRRLRGQAGSQITPRWKPGAEERRIATNVTYNRRAGT